MTLNFSTGEFNEAPPQSSKTLEELQGLFRDPSQLSSSELKRIVYQVFGCPGEVEGPARLLYATTVLQPGDVDGEFFMTRGHYHQDPTRGEIMLTLQGEGKLILMDRNRKTWVEPMAAGSTHDIDGLHAHRVANIGDVPLIFFVTWMSDCGHDYQPILDHGFSKRLFRSPSGPILR